MKKINELKLQKAETASINSSQKEIAEIMELKDVKHVFVLEKSKIKGIISITDILRKAVAKEKVLSAKELMTEELISIDPEATAGQALAIMLKANQYSLPVIKNEYLQGILTLTTCLGGLNEDS